MRKWIVTESGKGYEVQFHGCKHFYTTITDVIPFEIPETMDALKKNFYCEHCEKSCLNTI